MTTVIDHSLFRPHCESTMWIFFTSLEFSAVEFAVVARGFRPLCLTAKVEGQLQNFGSQAVFRNIFLWLLVWVSVKLWALLPLLAIGYFQWFEPWGFHLLNLSIMARHQMNDTAEIDEYDSDLLSRRGCAAVDFGTSLFCRDNPFNFDGRLLSRVLSTDAWSRHSARASLSLRFSCCRRRPPPAAFFCSLVRRHLQNHVLFHEGLTRLVEVCSTPAVVRFEYYEYVRAYILGRFPWTVKDRFFQCH